MNWEGRSKPFSAAFRDALTLSDAGVLSMLASAMGTQFGGDTRELRKELTALGTWMGPRPQVKPVAANPAAGITLATWRLLMIPACCKRRTALGSYRATISSYD